MRTLSCTTGADVMFADNTFAAARKNGSLRTFSRYEAVHITAADSNGNIEFQLLNLDFNNNYGGRDGRTDRWRAQLQRWKELGVWQHVAATWDGGASGRNIHIYINGVLSDGVSCDGQLPNSSDLKIPLTIGNRPVDNARGFNGSIADVRIYNGVLTAAQIWAIASTS